MQASYDLAVVGAGICGLAHAWAAARRGKRVVVIDRDARANGASVRNFGFVTVTGQQRGECWQRALRSRELWLEAAQAAQIPILQRGLLVVARRPQARALLETFLATEMGAHCRLVEPRELGAQFDGLRTSELAGALASPHELRVESREAIPRLAAWLEERHEVTFLRQAAVHGIELPLVATSRGPVHADAVVTCPGDDLQTLYAERLAPHRLTRCKLQMLRVVPDAFDPRLPPVMSDLGLVRYLGYAELPGAAALRARLEAEQGDHLRHGVHLIVVRSADGSLVVGDSHAYDPTPDPFAHAAIDRLILDEYRAIFDGAPPREVERWTGTYASSAERLVLVDRPAPGVRLVLITAGIGASVSFALAEEVIDGLYR